MRSGQLSSGLGRSPGGSTNTPCWAACPRPGGPGFTAFTAHTTSASPCRWARSSIGIVEAQPDGVEALVLPPPGAQPQAQLLDFHPAALVRGNRPVALPRAQAPALQLLRRRVVAEVLEGVEGPLVERPLGGA